jgi:hypothetical protein
MSFPITLNDVSVEHDRLITQVADLLPLLEAEMERVEKRIKDDPSLAEKADILYVLDDRLDDVVENLAKTGVVLLEAQLARVENPLCELGLALTLVVARLSDAAEDLHGLRKEYTNLVVGG